MRALVLAAVFTLLLSGGALAVFDPPAPAPAPAPAATPTPTPTPAPAAATPSPAAETPTPTLISAGAALRARSLARIVAAAPIMAEAQLRLVAGATIRERVQARLADASLNVDNTLPEECRALSEAEQRTNCRRVYATIRPCYYQAGTIACLREKLQVADTVQGILEECRGLTGGERSTCVQDIRERVYSLVKARFYALEERAEAFVEKNALDETLLVDFVADMEQLKVDFNAAQSIADKRTVLQQARERWHQFVREAVAAKAALGAGAEETA